MDILGRYIAKSIVKVTDLTKITDDNVKSISQVVATIDEKGLSKIKNNIILIGMPGAGKSTVGVILAKTLGYSFIDTDIVIQEREKRLLQDIIDNEGIEEFLKIEEEAILGLQTVNSVIATGGSAVYGNKAMECLSRLGKIVYLELGYEEIERRINNITTRGIAMKQGTSLKALYKERTMLYERYANETVDCREKSVEEVVGEILKYLNWH